MVVNLLAFVGIYGGIGLIMWVTWRITRVIFHGDSFLPHLSFPQRRKGQQETLYVEDESVYSAPTQRLDATATTLQISKSYNLKEMETDSRVWGITVAGMIHHLYTVYTIHEGQTIARDRYINKGWFTSSEYEYLIGPEKDGKQSQPGLLRRAQVVMTTHGNGQPSTTVLTCPDPGDAIQKVFIYLENQHDGEEEGYIAQLGGYSYFIHGKQEDEIDEENDEDEAPD